MKQLLLLCMICLSVTITAQKNTKRYDLSNFTKIKGSGYVDIEVIHSEDEGYVMVTNDIKMEWDNLDIEIDGLELEIGIKKGDYKEHPVQITVYTQVNKLTEMKAFGNAEITMLNKKGVESSEIELNAQAGGNIHCYFDGNTVEATVNQGGRITLQGKAENLEAKVNTGGTIAAFNLTCQTVVAKIKVGGEIFVLPIKKLDAKVSAGGKIMYRGNPESLKTKTLGGTIEKMGTKKEE